MSSNLPCGYFFIIGLSLGSLLTTGAYTVISSSPHTYYSRAKAAIEECELNLPRSKHCIITAIPESQQ